MKKTERFAQVIEKNDDVFLCRNFKRIVGFVLFYQLGDNSFDPYTNPSMISLDSLS